MAKKSRRNMIRELEKSLLRHKALYYQGCAEISDTDYDKLEDSLREFDPKNAVLKSVGTKIISSEKIEHKTKMLSLNKTYKRKELERWMGDNEVISMHKIDGCSCSLIYKEGRLSCGKTRGDGSFGEDITDKVVWIDDIPKQLFKIKKGEVRGEIYCDRRHFSDLIEGMKQLKLEPPKSQRNIVAGLLGRKENAHLCRHLSFFAFDLISGEIDIKTEYEKVIYLKKKLSFQVPPFEFHKKGEKIEEVIKQVRLFMSDGDYLIDGVVFAHNDVNFQEELGNTAHHPRFKMAFKFPGQTRKTKINKLIWSVSRSGHLVPVAIVDPVEISGAVVSRVALHNYAKVKEYELKRNDEIEIIRSGEVIPKFLGVTKSSENKFIVPKKCPSCGTKVVIKEIRLVCPNKECPSQKKESILHFIHKIGIEGLSSKRLDGMMEKKLVKDTDDLYRLTKDDLLILEKTKDKLAGNILFEIEKSKGVDIAVFLSALGISGGAYNKCERIVEAGFNTIKKLKKLNKQDLCKIDLFAEKSSGEFLCSLQSKWKLVDELVKLGFKLKTPAVRGQALKGKRVVVTGILSKRRSEFQKNLKGYGCVVSSNISKNTDYLICNDKNGTSSKLNKARELDVMIISEEQLGEILSSHG